MSVEVETKKIIIIRDRGGDERLRMWLDEEGDLQLEQNSQTFYLMSELHDDFRKGVAKLFAGRPAKRKATGNPIGY